METPEALAVMVANCVAEGEPAVAVKVALEAPEATVTETGTVRALLFEDRETVKELEAAAVRLTVQVALPPAARVAGLHESEFRAAATARFSEVLTEVPFKVAVI